MAARGFDASNEPLQKCLRHLASLIIPPFPEAAPFDLSDLGQHVFDEIATAFDAEAVSLFMPDPVDGESLTYRYGAGFDKSYSERSYKIDQRALQFEERSLTVHVYSEREEVNLSKKKLFEPDCRIPHSKRLGEYLLSKHFRNILSVPLVRGKRSLGVLTLLNKKGTSETQVFPKRDVSSALVLAATLTAMIHQANYYGLWMAVEHAGEKSSSLKDYLQHSAKAIRMALGASACGIYLPDVAERELHLFAGDGCKVDAKDQTHTVGTGGTKHSSSVAWLFAKRQHFAGSLAQLAKEASLLEIDFPPDGPDSLSGDTPDNLLGIALVPAKGHLRNPSEPCLGVLKIENLPTEDLSHDEAVIQPLIFSLLVPHARKLQSQSAGENPLYQFGPPPKGRKEILAFLKRILAQKESGELSVTNNQIAAYLQMGRTKLQTLIKEIKKD